PEIFNRGDFFLESGAQLLLVESPGAAEFDDARLFGASLLFLENCATCFLLFLGSRQMDGLAGYVGNKVHGGNNGTGFGDHSGRSAARTKHPRLGPLPYTIMCRELPEHERRASAKSDQIL